MYDIDQAYADAQELFSELHFTQTDITGWRANYFINNYHWPADAACALDMASHHDLETGAYITYQR